MIMEYGIITPLFADLSTVNPVTLKDVIIMVIGIGGFVILILNHVKKPSTAITPDPLNVRNIDKLATRDFVQERDREYVRRLDGHDDEISQLREDMKEDRKQNEIHASARSGKIYDEISNLRKELTEKIDDMPDRVIDTLNKLGKLK